MDQSLASRAGGSKYGQQLCLLSLDGGGVRGLSSLLIIKKLMESINPNDPPKPCDYFDMIGGTSTGGLIAIMLGRLHMTVDECIAEYKRLSPNIFTKIHHRVNWQGRLRGRFDDNALKEGVRSLLKRNNFDPEELFKEDSSQPGCRTFVCATSEQTSETVVLSSYYSDRRGNDLRKVAKIWEVARATSAATSFFDGISIGGEGFKDGGTGANNPINELWTEAADTFSDPDDPGWRLEENLKCLVSIGTGQLLLTAFGTSLIKNEVGEALVAITTNCDKTADTFHKHHSNLFQDKRAFRFNVEQGLENVGLEEATKVPEIESATRRYIQTEGTRIALKGCATNLKERVWFQEIMELLSQNSEAQVPITGEEGADTSYAIVHTSAYEEWIGKGGALHYSKSPRRLNQPVKNDGLEHVALGAGKVLRESSFLEPVILYFRCPPLIQKLVLDSTTLLTGILQYRDYEPSSSTELADVMRSLTLQYLSCIATRLPRAAQLETILAICGRSNVLPPQFTNLLRSGSCSSVSHIFHTLVQEGTWPLVIALENADAIRRDEMEPFLNTMIEQSTSYQTRFIFSNTDFNVTALPLGSKVRQVTASAEYSECLKCIDFERKHVRLEEIVIPESGTTEWIWSHPAYLSWEQCLSGILWIQGKPGSGKSVLAKSILEQGGLKHSLGRPEGSKEKLDNNVLICDWFYSTRSGEELMAHTSAMQSILYQMLNQRPQLFTHFARIYRQYPALSTDWVTLPSLMEILKSIVTSGVVGVCVVDAMDESEDKAQADQRRATILRFFSTLVSDIPQSRMKFLVLSRPYPDIEQHFTRMRDYKHDIQTIILEHENSAAIEKIVTRGMQSIQRAMHPLDLPDEDSQRPPGSSKRNTLSYKQRKRKKRSQISSEHVETEESEKIRSYLINNADGVILWVTLMIESLKSDIETGLYTFPQLHKRLEGLPKDLNDLYRRILDELLAKLDEDHRLISRRALMWVSGANTIQPLRISELHEALAVPKLPDDIKTALRSQTDPIQRNKTPIFDDWSNFRYQLRQMCGPLIEVIKPTSDRNQNQYEDNDEVDRSDLVQLLHRTVKDFLANQEAAGHLSFSEDSAVTEVYETASAYAALVAPKSAVAYAPFWFQKGTNLSTSTREMTEYLNNKILMRFFFTASENHSPLRRFGTDVPVYLYNALSSLSQGIAGKRKLSQKTFAESSPTSNSRLEEVATLCIYHACTEGLLTAVEIVLYLLSKFTARGGTRGFLQNLTHVLLLAAIKNNQPDAVTSLIAMSRPDLDDSSTPHPFWNVFQKSPDGTILNRLELAAVRTGNYKLATLVYESTEKVVRQPEMGIIDPDVFNFIRNHLIVEGLPLRQNRQYPTNTRNKFLETAREWIPEVFNVARNQSIFKETRHQVPWQRSTEAKQQFCVMIREWMAKSGESDTEDTDCSTAIKMVLDYIKQGVTGFDVLVRMASSVDHLGCLLLDAVRIGVQVEYGFAKPRPRGASNARRIFLLAAREVKSGRIPSLLSQY